MAELLKTFDLAPQDLKMIIVWAICFVALWQILARVLFNPYLRLVESREAVTTGAGESAKLQLAQADELLAQYEDRLTQARVNGMKEKMAIINRTRSEAQEILEKSERAAQDKIRANREDLQNRLTALKSELERDCDSMVSEISNKLKAGSQARL